MICDRKKHVHVSLDILDIQTAQKADNKAIYCSTKPTARTYNLTCNQIHSSAHL